MKEYTLESVRRTIQEVKSLEGTMKGKEYRNFLTGLYELEREIIRKNSDKGKILDFKQMEVKK